MVGRIRDDLEVDPARFDQLERRLGRIHDLARKHRLAPVELAAHRDRVATELAELRGAGERLQQLDGEIADATSTWRAAAALLSATRRAAAEALSTATSVLIAELGMGGGRFLVELVEQEGGAGTRPDPNGAERVEFMVAANAGQPPRPLRKVASGGELSRISLAIEVAALGSDAVPTMVFDEVDSGIGGAVAEIVGRKLRALGRARQGAVRHPPAAGRRAGPRPLPGEQGPGGRHHPQRGRTARRRWTRKRTGADAGRSGGRPGGTCGGAPPARRSRRRGCGSS